MTDLSLPLIYGVNVSNLKEFLSFFLEIKQKKSNMWKIFVNECCTVRSHWIGVYPNLVVLVDFNEELTKIGDNI